MDYFEKFRKECEKIVKGSVERPPANMDADLAFPCFSLAKEQKNNPVLIAEELAKKKPSGLIKEIKAAGPYVNFYLDKKKFSSLIVKEALKKDYGKQKKAKLKYMVEFAHPNTHKPFHIGHVRNISIGESLSRILEYNGIKVIRANYQGDVGPHIAKCLWGYLNLGENPPSDIKQRGLWLGKIYALANQRMKDDKKIEEEITEINKKLYEGKDKKLIDLWKETRKWCLDYFNTVYRDFGVKYNRFYFESEVANDAIKTAESLLKKGIAKLSDDAIIMDLEKEGLGIFVLLTKNKTPVYQAKELALVKLEYGEYEPDRIIHVVGTEQALYFKQVFETFKFLNKKYKEVSFHLPYELVNLESGKMSSRSGTVITYDELLETLMKKTMEETKIHGIASDVEKTSKIISLAAIKYDMLKTASNRTITFNWEHALSLEGNTGPYLLYAYARSCSLIKKSKKKQKAGTYENEFSFVKKLSEFNSVVEKSADELKPHLVASFSFELASLFNEFYQKEHIIDSEREEELLALVISFKNVLEKSLFLLGIEVLEEM